MFVLALGIGLGVIALTHAAVYHVDQDGAGTASALLNSAQQIGVALGRAVLAAVAATISGTPGYARVATGAALAAGYGAALLVAAAILVAAGVLALASLDGQPKT